jgi:hypothetical protein
MGLLDHRCLCFPLGNHFPRHLYHLLAHHLPTPTNDFVAFRWMPASPDNADGADSIATHYIGELYVCLGRNPIERDREPSGGQVIEHASLEEIERYSDISKRAGPEGRIAQPETITCARAVPNTLLAIPAGDAICCDAK